MTAVQHIVNVSGGKDSTATYLLALEIGVPFRAVTADTGHEHPITYDYIHRLPDRTGGPPVEVVQADFSAEFDRRREYVAAVWPGEGIRDDVVRCALDALRPTGNPYLDLCLLKGRFPARKAQFCTQELKVLPMRRQVIWPLLSQGRRVVQWLGVRAQESTNRAALSMIGPDDDSPRGAYLFRPILHWTAAHVFERHQRWCVPPNPLYRLGMRRVGCMPCINACKGEIAEVARRWPEAIEKIRAWTALVAAASKRGAASFFPWDTGRNTKTIDDVVAWSMTSRGGRQYDLEALVEPSSCSSVYGLCE